MPFELAMIDGLLRISLSGVMTWQGIQDLIQAVFQLESGMEVIPHRITDLSAVTTIELDFSLVSHAAIVRKSGDFANHYWSAIVAPLPLHFGFARMYKSLGECPATTIEIFHTMAEAEAWIRDVRGAEGAADGPVPRP